MSDLQKMKRYIDDVKLWFSEIGNVLKNQRVEPSLADELNVFSRLLESVGDEPSQEFLVMLQQKSESLNVKVVDLFEVRTESLEEVRRVTIGGHTLPPLPYRYNALEPYISEEIMRLHHDKHHKSYVDGLNKAEKMMQRARETGEFELLKHWEREAAFNGSGHYLHTIFWDVMKPKGGGLPGRNLLNQITKDFGSFEQFKNHFSEAAGSAEGVGWAILVWAPRSGRLEILQAERHQLMTQWDTIPLLVLDVWEHAYYLQYKNERKEYVKNWWNVVNWKEVEERFDKASRLTWKQY